MTGSVSWKQALSSIFALLSGSALARLLSAIVTIVIARQIGVQAYGEYSASLALLGLTTVFFSLGLDSWILYAGGREPDKLNTQFASALSIKGVLGLVWFMAWWIIAPYLDQSSFPRILIVVGSLAIWLEELSATSWSALKARLRNDLTLVLMVCSQALFLAATLWLSSRGVQAPTDYVRGRLLAGLLAVGLSVLVVVRIVGLRLRFRAIPPALRGILPFAVSLAFTVIYGRADLAIVASKLGSEAAGVYAPALTVTNVLFLIPAAIFGVLVPILSGGDRTNVGWIQQITTRFALLAALTGGLLAVAIAWMSPTLIRLLFGASYLATADVLKLLSPVVAMRCLTTVFAAALVAVGWQTPRMGIQGLCAAINVLLNLILVQRVGVTGVATIYVLSESVLLVGTAGMFVVWLQRQRAVT